jgi:uncharacterized protein
MTIVLDSNVLLVAIGKRSRYRPIWEAFLNGSYKLVLSEDILFEYEEILLQHAASGAAEIVMEIFLESPDIIYQRVYYKWQAITNDVDDNKFFDVAIAANAEYLVTNDPHFNSAQKLGFPEVKIISAADFLEIIKSP